MTEESTIGSSADAGNGTLAAPDAGTLDAIFRRNAERRPDALALCDPPDRAAFTHGEPRRLTFAQADQAIAALSRRLQALGLPVDAVVSLQLPNTVEAVITLLAVLRAKMIAVPLPLLWRKAEASQALRQIGARALITCARVADVDHGEVALQIAAETFSIRTVCGFGAGVADGIVPLDEIFLERCAQEPGGSEHAGRADRVSVITFDVAPDGFVPIARTDTELLVGGLATVLEAEIPRHQAILSTLLSSSFAALATAMVPWLLTGGTLALHQPFDPAILAAQCGGTRFAALVLPGPLVHTLADAGLVARREEANAIVSVWRSPERQAGSPAWSHETALVDVLAFGEIGLIALRRGTDGKPRAIPAGAVTTPHGAEEAPAVVHVARTPAGNISLSGPMVPRRVCPGTGRARDDSAPVDTGYPCRFDGERDGFILAGAPPGLVSVGGYRFALRELQDLIGRVDAHSVLVALPDLIAGQKLAGLAGDEAVLGNALAALGINPLVGAAFARRHRKMPAA
jgi:AMP-binding enzyme